jgi:hypothetical protein
VRESGLRDQLMNIGSNLKELGMKSLTMNAWLLLGTVGAGMPPAFAAVDVSVGTETVSAGGVTTVDLDISGLGNGVALGTFDLNVGFNSAIVGLASTTFGGPQGDELNVGGYGTLTSATPGAGTVELFDLSLDVNPADFSSQPGSFTLAQLTFDGLKSGTSALTLSVTGYEAGLGDQYGNVIKPVFQDGSIVVSTAGGGGTTKAPEIDAASMGSALTLLFGVLAAFGARRRGRWLT